MQITSKVVQITTVTTNYDDHTDTLLLCTSPQVSGSFENYQ